MAQFPNFRRNPIANKKEVYVIIEGQNAQSAVAWQKTFYARRTRQKLSFYLKNFVQSSRTLQVLQQLIKFHPIFYGLNQSRKKTLNHPSNTITLNIIIVEQKTMPPICLQERKINAGNLKSMKKIKIHYHLLQQLQDANPMPQLWEN